MNKSRKDKSNSARTTSRRRPRRGGPAKSLRDGLRPLAGRIFRNRGLGDGGLVMHWTEVVGPELSGCCAPVKIAFPRSDGARVAGKAGNLHLLVEAGAATLVQHRQNEILTRVNGYLGYRAVDRITLAQGQVRPQASAGNPEMTPIREPETEDPTENIPATGLSGRQRLAAALARFERGIAARERQKTK